MATAKKKQANRQVIITTSFRGVYMGTLVEHDGNTCILENARMVIRWGTTDGVDQLASTGPTDNSKLGSVAKRVWLCGLTSVVDCTDAATAAWESRK